jgi:DNA mismatch repair protein MLH1
MPAFAGLPLFLLRMATDVDWEGERECFETLSREIG